MDHQTPPQLMAQPPPQLQPQQHFRYIHHSHRGDEAGGPVEMTREPPQSTENNDDSTCVATAETGDVVRHAALDRNLASLCDHIQFEGFDNGVFSDVVVEAFGTTYHLHRLILSRSSYFRNMLQGPWKEANAPVLTLHVDDKNVNGDAIATALAYLYGHYPELNDNNAFRVLAAASFLDLQDLCAICTDFIIAELWSSNFLTYQVFAENQDYGVHGERVRSACWGYLCQSGARELKEVLPNLSSQTLHALLTSDQLWVPSEEKRFELAVYTLVAKGELGKAEHHGQGNSKCDAANKKHLVDESLNKSPETKQGGTKVEDDGNYDVHSTLVELQNSHLDSSPDVSNGNQAQTFYQGSEPGPKHLCNIDQPSGSSSFYTGDDDASCSYSNTHISNVMNRTSISGPGVEGCSDETSFYKVSGNWAPGEQMNLVSSLSCNVLMPGEWERSDVSLSWGGRTVGKREVKTCLKRQLGMSREDYDSFDNVFEGGTLLYCNMSFEALLNVRKHLEEMGFPCKAVNDGLWLQMLLRLKVQEVVADTCKSCCLQSIACACRHPFGYSRGVSSSHSYYTQDKDQGNISNDLGHAYLTNSAQLERTGLYRPVRIHDRGPTDGLAGLGHGTTFVPATALPPARYVFSRVPYGVGNRSNQQRPANDAHENRAESNGELAGDGLTALVGLSQGSNDMTNVNEGQVEREYESIAHSGNVFPVQMDPSEHSMGTEWQNTSTIPLDLKTPLSHFPPFRFGVEFQDVHRLNDGQVKHSSEAFYAGSMWKISIQAFSDEDPQGRRTLGLFLHRRKAEITDPLRQVNMHVDSREKVTARYQLICPSKREVMVFGSYKQTLLPKAPKGWGWRTALLFNELSDLLQNGCALRVAAVVQLI